MKITFGVFLQYYNINPSLWYSDGNEKMADFAMLKMKNKL